MDSFFSLIKFFFGCGTLLVLVMVALAHMPKSPLRTALMQICGWATAALCGAYVVSPFDVAPEAFLGPFGLIDDLIAAIVGFISVRAAMKAGKEKAAEQESERPAE